VRPVFEAAPVQFAPAPVPPEPAHRATEPVTMQQHGKDTSMNRHDLTEKILDIKREKG